MLVASDLVRAVESAERLASDRPPVFSPLLREIPLPLPRLSFRAPYALWDALIHARWGIEIVRRCDTTPESRAQADEAADWLARCAREAPHGSVAAVTHGVFRRVLAHRLRARGWHPEGGFGGFEHWSVWRFRNESGAPLD
jgi:broad specificity phosphatase PhoE